MLLEVKLLVRTGGLQTEESSFCFELLQKTLVKDQNAMHPPQKVVYD